MRIVVNKIAFIILLLAMAYGLFAQSDAGMSNVGGISAYTYDGARSGVEKLKMNVYILGQVYKPGLYLVPDDTNFLTLLALAGGPRRC